jgi:hypothetical protein
MLEQGNHSFEIAEYNDERTEDAANANSVDDVDPLLALVADRTTCAVRGRGRGNTRVWVEQLGKKNQQASLEEILALSAHEGLLVRRWKLCLVVMWLLTASCIAVGTYVVLRRGEDKKYHAAVSTNDKGGGIFF